MYNNLLLPGCGEWLLLHVDKNINCLQQLHTNNDKSLFLHIAAGDENAFRELFDRYKIRFYAAALKMTRSEILAEEIVQEIFITLWLKRALLPTIEKPDTYLFTMVYNSVYRQFRKIALEKRTQLRAGIRSNEKVPETEEWLDARESQQMIHEAINKLPAQQQLVYKLSREGGLSREEIAHKLDISPNTVRNHLREALKNIRSYLQEATGLATLLLIIHS